MGILGGMGIKADIIMGAVAIIVEVAVVVILVVGVAVEEGVIDKLFYTLIDNV
jgi:hypothetical protein